MRIISGKFKGRRFKPPASFKGRPTTDFARESLFNILRFRAEMEGSTCLDLFAGTGAMTYELLSHGAKRVTAIEKTGAAVHFIRTSAEVLAPGCVQVVQGDVFKILPKMPGSFDIIIADPPFDHPGLPELPHLIAQTGILAPKGVLVLEHGPDLQFEDQHGFDDYRRYGHVHFSFFNFDKP